MSLPSMRFLCRKSLFKSVFDQNTFICQPIFKVFAAYFVKHSIVPRKYSSTFKQLQIIFEKPLPDTRIIKPVFSDIVTSKSDGLFGSHWISRLSCFIGLPQCLAHVNE